MLKSCLNVNSRKWFTDKDLKTLSNCLSVSKRVVSTLFEEEADADLLLDTVSSKLATVDNLELSKPLQTKLIIFHLSKTLGYDLAERSYVARVIYSELPKIIKKIDAAVIHAEEPSEKNSQYLLVLLGLYSHCLAPDYPQGDLIAFTREGFPKFKNSKNLIRDHVVHWIKFLRDSKDIFLK